MLTLCALCTQLSSEGVEPQGFPSKKKAHVARCVQHTHGERLCVLSSFVPYAFLPRVTAAAAAPSKPHAEAADPPQAPTALTRLQLCSEWQPATVDATGSLCHVLLF